MQVTFYGFVLVRGGDRLALLKEYGTNPFGIHAQVNRLRQYPFTKTSIQSSWLMRKVLICSFIISTFLESPNMSANLSVVVIR